MSLQAYQKAATWAESPRQMEYRLFAQVTLALMEAAIILATIGQRYKFTLAPDAEIDIKPQITLLPKYGMPAILEFR